MYSCNDKEGGYLQLMFIICHYLRGEFKHVDENHQVVVIKLSMLTCHGLVPYSVVARPVFYGLCGSRNCKQHAMKEKGRKNVYHITD
jgi:hypothetical protein